MTDSGKAPRQYADWFTILRGKIAETSVVSAQVVSPIGVSCLFDDQTSSSYDD